MVSQLFLFTVLLFPEVNSDEEFRFHFHRFMHDQRLSGENVRSVFKDSYGFIWFSIDSEGLCKYDGSEIEFFGHTGSDTTTISSNYINDIAEDRDGNIWLATDKGLDVFERRKRKFRKMKLPPTVGRMCNTILRDRNDAMWAGTDRGLVRFMTTQDANPDHVSATAYLPDIFVKCLMQAEDGSYWVGTKAGLYQLTSYIEQADHWSHSAGANTLSDNEINAILQLNKNYLLIGTDNGVNLFDRTSQRFHLLAFRESGVFNAAKVGIVDLFMDSEDVVWIGTSSYGVLTGPASIDGIGSLPVSITLPEQVTGISSMNITAFCEDASDQIWVSTKFGGINIHDRRSQLFEHYELPPLPDQHETGYNHVLAALEDRREDLWLGTRNRGLLKYDRYSGVYREIEVYQGHGQEEVRRIEVVMQSADGLIWLGHKKGINSLNPETHQQQYQELPKVFSIAEDSNRNLWIGTLQGVFYKNADSDQVIRFNSNQSFFTDEQLEVDQVFCDSRGSLWFGTNDQGIFRYFPSNDSLEHYVFNASDSGSISGNTIRSIYEDSKGQIWIGTKSSGLNLYDGSGFVHLGKGDGLPSNSVFSILEDANQTIWIATNNGVSRYRPVYQTFENFNKNHGLQSNVFEKKACLKTNDGNILVAGNNGYNLFNPNDITLDHGVPGVVITSIRTDGLLIDRDVSDYKVFNVPYDQNMISLEFSSFDFRDRNAIRYAYRLRGVDDNWIHSGNQNAVTYSNLSPGEYTFDVKSTNADGIWSSDPLKILFIVGKPLWMEWWAYVIYFCLICTMLYLIYYIATVRATYYHQLQTTEMELHRTQELHRLKLNFFTNISHELRTPLTLIMASIEKLMKTGASEGITKTVKSAYRSTKQLLNLTDQLLYFRRIENGNLPLRVIHGDLHRHVSDLVASFQELADREGIRLTMTPQADNSPKWYDEDKVEKIVSNLLLNAFKYTDKGGEIAVSYTCSNTSVPSSEDILPGGFDQVQISVRDNGRGITPEQLDHIFDRYYQTDIINTGGGIGLDLVKRLVELHKGHILVKSEPGEGSLFTVCFPVSKGAYEDSEIREGFIRQNAGLAELLVDLPLDLEEPLYLLEEDPAENCETDRQKLLIVEDSRELAVFLKESLRAEFFIVVCRSGNDALERVNSFHPDIILSDVMMPGISGTELCRRLKQNPETGHIPVVLLTAKVLQEHQKEGYECGADAYVTKPFSIVVLIHQLKSILRNRKFTLTRYDSQPGIAGEKLENLSGGDHVFLKKIDEIIRHNYDNADFSVEEFAYDLHMSRSQLFRKVKALTDQTPSEYLYAFRMKKAMDLLGLGELTIAEIAYATGFKSPNSFTKTFTKHVGISPSRYGSRLTFSAKR